MKNLKKNGYKIISYARRSPTGEDVSPCSWASSRFVSRDLQGNLQVMDDLSVDGNTHDLLAYLKSVYHYVCLVIIDFAGIITRSEDIVNLVEANPSLIKIAIETFALWHEVFVLTLRN